LPVPDPTESPIPSSIDAERAVLGAILLTPALFASARERLRREWFYVTAHQRIWASITRLSEQPGTLDILLVAEDLKRHGDFEAVGGFSYLASLADGIPKLEHVGHYADIIRDRAALRACLKLANDLAEKALSGETSGPALATTFARKLDRIASYAETTEPETAREISAELLETPSERSSGVKTGFATLDRLTLGLQPGDLWYLAAFTSVGKTALALRIAFNAAWEGRRVDILSLEMTTKQTLQRLISLGFGIDLLRLRSGLMFPEEYKSFTEAQEWLEQAPIRIVNAAGKSSSELRARLQRRRAEGDVDLCIVDYIGIIAGAGRRIENRAQEVAAISRDLKLAASETGIPVLALAQINREGARSSSRPHLTWLKDSGGQENDADAVMFLQREPEETSATLWLSKQRNGPTGEIALHWMAEYGRYDEIAEVLPATTSRPDGGREWYQ
jgi:replicative DNA helicase